MAGGHRNADYCSGNALWLGVLLLLSTHENNPLDKVRIHDQEVWQAEQNIHRALSFEVPAKALKRKFM